MLHSFRSLIQNSTHLGPESIPSWRRAGFTLFVFFTVLIWIAAAGTFVATALVIFARAAMYSQNTGAWSDMKLVFPVAALFAGASVIARGFVPTFLALWLKLEDILGRAIVFFHSGTHTFSGQWGHYIRQALAIISITTVLLGELVCLKWAFALFDHLSLNKNASFIYLMGNQYTFLFSLDLTLACVVIILLVRYTVSAKWQAIYVKPQFTEGILPIAPNLKSNVSILHASDFHITATDDQPLTEGGRTFSAAVLTSIMAAIAQDACECNAVLLTGDITDTGSAAEWERFLDCCPPEVLRKLILVPGNHDLNLQDHRLALKAEQYNSAGRQARKMRMIGAMAEVMQDRAYVLDPSDRLFPLNRYIERHQKTFQPGADSTGKLSLSVDALWQTLFPMVVLVDREPNGKRLGVLVLDSVKPGSLGLTNAIGTVPPEVINRASALMNKMADRCDCFVVALHHHVAMPTGGSLFQRVQNSGLVLENASLLIDMLAKRGDPTVVFHGHRHKVYTGTAAHTDVAIVASPSASIGKHGEAGQGSWRIVDLVCSEDGCWLPNAPRTKSVQDSRIASALSERTVSGESAVLMD